MYHFGVVTFYYLRFLFESLFRAPNLFRIISMKLRIRTDVCIVWELHAFMHGTFYLIISNVQTIFLLIFM